jgi:hypothetical protein
MLKYVFSFIVQILLICGQDIPGWSKESPMLPLYLPAVISGHHQNWWQPMPGTSWQWQLSGTIDTSYAVRMYDLDLFDAPTGVIDQLHALGKVVICYISAGSWEAWRPDAGTYPAEILGSNLEGWPDEKWLDIRKIQILGPILEARLDLAVAKKCDGIEPDNVDGFQNPTGFSLSYRDQFQFNTWLAEKAHSRGLSIGLKNDLDQIGDLVSYFDWALNEECFAYGECEKLLPFIESGKAVFGVEYTGELNNFCSAANAMNFDWLKKHIDLDAWRAPCR